MPTLENLAARFARCVSLFRDPGAKDQQKAEFRALIGLLKETAVTLRIVDGRLELNAVPCDGEGIATLVQRLELHDIGEIALAPDPPPAQLFELLRALAEQPGASDVAHQLASADRIRVAPAPRKGPSAPRGPVASPEDFDSRDPVVPRPGDVVDRTSGALGTGGLLHGEAWKDIKSVPLSGVPLVTHDPPPPPAADALPRTGRAGPPQSPPSDAAPPPSAPPSAPSPPPAPSPSSPPASTGRGASDAAPPDVRAEAAAPPAPPARKSAAAETPRAARESLPAGAADALAELEGNPLGPNVGDILAALIRHAETAIKQTRFEQMLGVIAGVIKVEQRVPETSGMRRQYAIALRRIYTKPVLEALARLLGTPKHRPAAVTALQRGGAAAVEVLMDMLVAAPTVTERRAVFDALKQMTEGTEQLVHMLDHPEWFVVRNVAELLGELGMDEAVPALGRRLDHADERVRKAVALALAKIGSRSAAEPLRRALRDRSAEVRLQVAVGIGRKASALAMPLVVAMEEEKDEAIVRELLLALGRIGSAEAVQALIKWAQPAGRIFGRRPSALRVAAVEGLRLAATPAALGTLEGLSDDGDRQVRDAAKNAVLELKRPRAKKE